MEWANPVLPNEVFLTCLWGFIFKNVIAGYVMNFVYWLLSLVVSAISDKLALFAYYDASNRVYQRFMKYLSSGESCNLNIGGNLVYSLGIIIVVIAIAFVFRKRWERNGI